MLDIKSFGLGMMGTNCYLVSKGKDAIIIDPAVYSEQVSKCIKEKGLTVKGVFLTHGHFDHVLGCPEFSSEFGVKTYIGAEDMDILFDCSKDAGYMVGLKYSLEENPEIVELYDNDVIELGELKFKVITTPGHTKGGVSYYFEDDGILFSGDTLFFRSVGRTDLYGSNYQDLVHSIRNKLYTLPEKTKVYCGHSQPTEIGYEKTNNMIVWAE